MLKQKKSLKYCCVCKGMYRGKVLDGRTVSLHRFPQNKRLKRVWIQRCRTVLKNFQWTENRLLCSEHFVDRKGPSSTHTIPSIFPTASGTEKIFPYSALDENDQPQEDIQEEMFTATPLVVNDVPVVVSETNEQEKYENQSIIQENHHSNLDVSLIFHDYTNEPISAPSAIRMVETQTCLDYCTSETQTDLVRTCVSVGTQTCSVECRDSGEQTNLPTLVYEDVKDHPSKLNFYTGIPNKGIFNALFHEMGDMKEERPSRCKRPSGGRPRALRLVDEFFMVLLRLRLGLLVDDLAARFCISSTACSRLLNKWIDYLDVKLNFLIMWPVKSVVDFNMPKLFRDKFPDTRVIIDCTEIKTETPSSLQLKSLMYSDYKSHITWKSLVGISPSGHVTFVSDLWVGSISDKKLTEKCGILDLCEEGDAIMADKGFLISDLTTPRGIKLIMPPFKRGKSKFSKREVKATRDIANARIHVERQMERIKNFRIVQGIMPITMSLRASKVWKLCAKLTNLQPPLVPH